MNQMYRPVRVANRRCRLAIPLVLSSCPAGTFGSFHGRPWPRVSRVGSIINGRAWIKERTRHLEAALDDDSLGADQHAAIKDELDNLRAEGAAAGRHRRWWWLLGGRRP